MYKMQWGQATPPCKALQEGRVAENNLDLIIPGIHRGLLFHEADGKTKCKLNVKLSADSHCKFFLNLWQMGSSGIRK